MVIRTLVTVVCLSMWFGLAACDTTADVPDLGDTVPIVDGNGETVGTADADDLSEAIQGGEPAEVRSDGELVGYFGEQFTPLEDVVP